MRECLRVFPPILLVFACLPGSSADLTRLELQGNYSYWRYSSFGPDRQNDSGWSAGVGVPIFHGIRAVGEVGQFYGDVAFGSGSKPNIVPSTRTYTSALFGVEGRVWERRRFSIRARAMGGLIHSNGVEIQIPMTAIAPIRGRITLLGGNVSAISLGGSAILRMSQHLSYTIARPEWVLVDVCHANTRVFRVSTGLIFGFGN